VLATLAVYAYDFRGSSDVWPIGVLVLAPLGLASIALHSARVGAQVLARAAIWTHLGVGAAASTLGGPWQPVVILATTATALFALGAPFAGERTRTQFDPRGFRNLFLWSAAALVIAAHILAVAGAVMVLDWHRRVGAVCLIESSLLAASVIGVLRMRAWGVLAAIAAAAGGALFVAAASVPSTRHALGIVSYDSVAMRLLVGAGAVVALSMVSPLVIAWLRPLGPKSADKGRTWGKLHGALVACAVLAGVVGQAIHAAR
jgi:hypothetical protein